MPFMVRLSAMMVAALLLSGCDPFSTPDGMMDEYVERVARVLDEDYQLSTVPPRTPYPRTRDRVQSLPDLDLGILDFLSLMGCELQFVVGERNSILGRVMQPVNRLRYELRFIEAANACAPDIRDEQLRDDILAAAESKKESLPLAVWNATFGSEESARLLTSSQGYYPLDASGDTTADLESDLGQVKDMVLSLYLRNTDVSVGFMNQVHQRWNSRPTAGQLINSARILTTRLDDASEVLERRLDGRPLCIGGKPNNQSEIVRNTFFNVYVGRVQPYMAEVRRGRDSLVEPLSALVLAQDEVVPSSFADWHDQYLAIEDDSIWGRLDQSMSRHVAGWQQLLEQCGMRPGA